VNYLQLLPESIGILFRIFRKEKQKMANIKLLCILGFLGGGVIEYAVLNLMRYIDRDILLWLIIRASV